MSTDRDLIWVAASADAVTKVVWASRALARTEFAAPVPTAVAAQMNAACVLGVAVGSQDKSAPSGCQGLHQPSWVREADVLLEPEVHHIDWNDFSRIDEARAAGAAAMRQALPQMLKILDRRSQLGRATHAATGMESGLAS